MPWFTSTKKEKETKEKLKKEDLWIICKKCNAHVYKEQWYKNISVCPKCGYHGRLTCEQRIDLIFDAGTFEEFDSNVTPSDPLKFVDGNSSYGDKLEKTKLKTGLKESVVTGVGDINGIKAATSIMDFRFFGGSLGSGTGEKIIRAANYAYDNNLPYIIFSASGGARMQEGMLSLMQMAKTCAWLSHLNEKGLPFISVLTDPTSGGVSASFAMVGDINIAEPGALIAFAGRRVIEQTIKQKLPKNFQTSEYLLENGFVDIIEHRKNLKDRISQILSFYNRKHKKTAKAD